MQISLQRSTKSMAFLFHPTVIPTVSSTGNSDAFSGSRNVTERTTTEGNNVLYSIVFGLKLISLNTTYLITFSLHRFKSLPVLGLEL